MNLREPICGNWWKLRRAKKGKPKRNGVRIHPCAAKGRENVPVDVESVGKELVVQESVRGKDGPDGDPQVHEFASKEPESVAVVFVVDVLLEVSQHPTHFFF